MKVLVTGARGQLGYDVIRELNDRGHDAIGIDIEDLDITKEVRVDQLINDVKPDSVIHCAAWTAVDAAEDENNKEKVYAVNVDGTKYIAKACKKLDCKMIYLSTDYVFNGLGETPWNVDDKLDPISVYGKSKYKGELAVEDNLDKYYIVRISWVFGKNGNNFVKTMLNLGKTRDALSIVDDQIGTPTYTYDLSRLLVDMSEKEEYGKYHATNEGGYISWYDFTVEIMFQAGNLDSRYNDVMLKAVNSNAFSTNAKRPNNSRLNKSTLIDHGFELLPTWQDALRRFLKEIEV